MRQMPRLYSSRGVLFWRFYGFAKQLPHLVHSLSQLCDIFGINAVGGVDLLANLIDIDADLFLSSKFSSIILTNRSKHVIMYLYTKHTLTAGVMKFANHYQQ